MNSGVDPKLLGEAWCAAMQGQTRSTARKRATRLQADRLAYPVRTASRGWLEEEARKLPARRKVTSVQRHHSRALRVDPLPESPSSTSAAADVVRVCERAAQSGAAAVHVRHGRPPIADAVRAHGHSALMTAPSNASGTDRIARARQLRLGTTTSSSTCRATSR